MIIDAYSLATNESYGMYSVYKTELRAKNQSKTAFASRKGVTKYALSNSITNAEVVTDTSHSDFYDNRLAIRFVDTTFNMCHEVSIPMSYFIKNLLPFCEGNKILTELAYVPKFGIILKSSTEYKSWEIEYLKEYTELGARRSGTGLYNGKRSANKSDVMYFNDRTLIQYIGRYTVPEDITVVQVSQSWRGSSTTNKIIVIPAGKYYAYAEKGLSYKRVEVKLTAAPRKLYAVDDLTAQESKLLKNYTAEQLRPFFYDCFVFGFGRRQVHSNSSNNRYEDVRVPIHHSSTYHTCSIKDVVFDLFKQEIRMK